MLGGFDQNGELDSLRDQEHEEGFHQRTPPQDEWLNEIRFPPLCIPPSSALTILRLNGFRIRRPSQSSNLPPLSFPRR